MTDIRLQSENLRSHLEWCLKQLTCLVDFRDGTAYDGSGDELAGFAVRFSEAKAALASVIPSAPQPYPEAPEPVSPEETDREIREGTYIPDSVSRPKAHQ